MFHKEPELQALCSLKAEDFLIGEVRNLSTAIDLTPFFQYLRVNSWDIPGENSFHGQIILGSMAYLNSTCHLLFQVDLTSNLD